MRGPAGIPPLTDTGLVSRDVEGKLELSTLHHIVKVKGDKNSGFLLISIVICFTCFIVSYSSNSLLSNLLIFSDFSRFHCVCVDSPH